MTQGEVRVRVRVKVAVVVSDVPMNYTVYTKSFRLVSVTVTSKLGAVAVPDPTAKVTAAGAFVVPIVYTIAAQLL